jgi:hypothetical protein
MFQLVRYLSLPDRFVFRVWRSNMRSSLKVLGIFAAVVVGLAFTSMARADIVPSLDGSVTGTPGDYTFTYQVTLSDVETLVSGDEFTIYDFADLVPGDNTQPAGWTYSSADVGPVPTGEAPTDNASVPNVTWTYSGSAIVGNGTLGNLGDFTVVSTETVIDEFGDYAADATHTADTTYSHNGGEVPVPSSSVPLPAADWMGLSGLATLAAYLFLRRRSNAI